MTVEILLHNCPTKSDKITQFHTTKLIYEIKFENRFTDSS